MKNFFMFQQKEKKGVLRATIEMRGNQVFKMAVNTLDMIVDETLNAK